MQPDGLPGATMPTISGFSVRVEQLDAPEGTVPFQWNGFANAFGRFQVATPPGQYRVTAMDIFHAMITTSIPPSISAPSASTIVNVSPKAVTVVKLIITDDNYLPYAPGTSSTE
jgi:hypothetical protein